MVKRAPRVAGEGPGPEVGAGAAPRQGGSGPLVAFDFDGTLTSRDSFKAFLAWRAGPVRYGVGVLRLLPELVRWTLIHDHERLKARTVAEFLAGAPRAALEDEAQAFCQQSFTRLMRPDALACWQDWRAASARLVIVSATPETVLAPFAARLGASRLIATQLAFGAEDRVLPGLAGHNCRGPEKVRRIRAELGRDVRLAAAYGDSDGDTAMLALAEEPHMKLFEEKP